MRVLVPDDGHVEVAVDARGIEGPGDRLPQVHVRDRRLPVRRRDLVGVVARREARGWTARHASGLGVALLVVVPEPTEAEVVLLQVEGLLREAEMVGPVVHAVVPGEQVRPRGVDVVPLGRGERRVRVAPLLEPLVRPPVDVVAVGTRRGRLGPDRERVVAEPVVNTFGVVPIGREGRPRAGVDVPLRTGRARAEDPVTAGPGRPAPELARVGRGVVEGRRRREDLPGRLALVVDQALLSRTAPLRASTKTLTPSGSAAAPSRTIASYAGTAPAPGIGRATSRMRCGLAKPSARKTVQPSASPSRVTAPTLLPAEAAARRNASVGDRLAAPARSPPASDDDT